MGKKQLLKEYEDLVREIYVRVDNAEDATCREIAGMIDGFYSREGTPK